MNEKSLLRTLGVASLIGLLLLAGGGPKEDNQHV
jgi:hypothetical protein